jgi:acetyltransferase
MLQETKFYALLKGARGEKSVDIENLILMIYKLSILFIENKDISSIDINPIFSDENENIIVDAKFFL